MIKVLGDHQLGTFLCYERDTYAHELIGVVQDHSQSPDVNGVVSKDFSRFLEIDVL